MEKLSVVCCLVFVCILLLCFSAPQHSSAASANTIRKPAVVAVEPASVSVKVDTTGKPGVKSGTQRVLGDTSVKDTTRRDLLKEVIADLEKEKLVKPEDVESLSFKLTGTELVINDVKQPGDIQKKLSQKYITTPTMKIMYRWRGE